jgi:hypothetical protein
MTTFRSKTLVVLLVAVGAFGCSKTPAEEESRPARIEPLPKAEVERAQKACTTYVERVCACAETHPELSQQCELAKASPGALQINLDLLASVGLEVAEQKAVKVEARKIAAVCFEADGKLDVAMCPRKTL